MARMIPFALISVTMAVACSSDEQALSAEDELTLSAISGPEETMSYARGAEDGSGVSADIDAPPPFRECDASGTYQGLFSDYDGDTSGALEDPEREDVHGARDGRDAQLEHMIRGRWLALTLIYDVDADGAISESERNVLLEDFTIRCDALSARLVEEFDADGDGELSEAEQDAAMAEMQARHEEHRAAMEENRPEGEAGGEGGPGGGPEGERPEEGEQPPLPPFMEEYDLDGDGQLNGAELEPMQAAFREIIRTGEPFCEPPRD